MSDLNGGVTLKLESIKRHHANAAVLLSGAAGMIQQAFGMLNGAAHETAAALKIADLDLTQEDMDAAAVRLNAASKAAAEAQRKGPRILRPGE